MESLIERLARRVASHTSDEAAAVMTEDVVDFLAPQRWRRERDQFFLSTPQVVGFSGQIAAPGSCLTVEVMGVPLVLTRDLDGDLHCFVNACAHRGARVARESRTCQRLTCGFHGWTYGLDGRLRGRRHDGAFEPIDDSCRLIARPVSDRSGLLVVGVGSDVDQAAVDDHLVDIEAQLAGFRFDEVIAVGMRRFEVAANWKVVAALSFESYHFATLHRDSVAKVMTDEFVWDSFGGRHSRWAFAMNGIERLLNSDRASWPNLVPGAVSHALFPGTVVIVSPGGSQLLRTEPGGDVGTSIVTYSGVRLPSDRPSDALAAFEFGGAAFENEDLVAAVECQRGLSAGTPTIRIGRNEPVVQFWHERWRNDLHG